MVGFKKVEKYDSPTIETPKYKRRNLFSRLGHRISRAFHRTHHDDPPKRIAPHHHSRSTGDLLNDVQSSSGKPASTNERLHDHSDTRTTSISADDRANSVGYIQGVCTSPSSERPNPAFLPSAFREELNSKLRLGSGPGAPGFRGPNENKSADSCDSLASNDSLLCTPSPLISGDSATTSMTRSTHEPHITAAASPSSHHSVTATTSPNLAGMQHKLAVGRQHKRRPPTRSDQVEEPTKPATSTPLTLGCTHFFASSNSTTPILFTHSPMDLISEEGSEADSKSSNTPKPTDTTQSSRFTHSEPSHATLPPIAAPRQYAKHAPRVNHNVSEPGWTASSDGLTTPTNRPVSMFVAPHEPTTPIESQNHQHHHSLLGSTTGRVSGNSTAQSTPKKPPRIKSRSISEQSQDEEKAADACTDCTARCDTRTTLDSEQNSAEKEPPRLSCNQTPGSHSIATGDNSISETVTSPSSTSPKNMPSTKTPLSEPAPTARPRNKFGAQFKPTPFVPPNGVPTAIASNLLPVGRPTSMFFPAPPTSSPPPQLSPPQKSTPNCSGSIQASRSKSCSSSHDTANHGEGDGAAPERTSVSDRAALFGAKLHATKSQRSSSGVAAEPVRDKTNRDENAGTTNTRPVSVFDLVRNFEQPH